MCEFLSDKTSLTKLSLSIPFLLTRNKVTLTTLKKIHFESPSLPNLETLSFVLPENAKISLFCSSVTSINLNVRNFAENITKINADCRFTSPADLQKFCEIISCSSGLTSITIAATNEHLFTESLHQNLEKIMKKNNLKEFSFTFHPDCSKQLTWPILELLSVNTTLKSFSWRSMLNDQDTKFLSEIIMKNSTLKSIEIGPLPLSMQELSKEKMEILKTAFWVNNFLKRISVFSADVDIEFLWDILPKNTVKHLYLETAITFDNEPITFKKKDFLFQNFSTTSGLSKFWGDSCSELVIHERINKGNF